MASISGFSQEAAALAFALAIVIFPTIVRAAEHPSSSLCLKKA